MEQKPDTKHIHPWEVKVEVNKNDLAHLKNKITCWGRLVNEVAASVYTDECIQEQLYIISDAILASVNENYDEERYNSEIWDLLAEDEVTK